MPVQRCQLDGRPGWRWGQQGKCYTYTPGDQAGSNEAKRKAHVQGAAIGEAESEPMGKKKSKPDGVELCEAIELAEAKIDATAGLVPGVKILGTCSRNGREYTEQALRKAAPMYEGVRVNIDHERRGPTPDGSPPDRSYRDRFGSLKNVRFERDGLYGDLHFNPRHPISEQFVWDVEHAPHNVGFSHRAFGHGRQVGDRYVVEEIDIVRSVDLVADPATTRSLFESEDPITKPSEDKEKVVTKTIKEICEAFKDSQPAKGMLALIEEDMGLGALPVPLPEPSESLPAEDRIWAAFRAAVNAVLDDDKMDIPASIKRIGEILRSYEKLEEKPEEKPKEEKKGDGGEASESVRNELAELKAKLAKAEANQAAVRLLQESRLPANPLWVEAVAALPEANRKAFIETLPKTAQDPRSSMPLSESAGAGGNGQAEAPKDAKEFASRLVK